MWWGSEGARRLYTTMRPRSPCTHTGRRYRILLLVEKVKNLSSRTKLSSQQKKKTGRVKHDRRIIRIVLPMCGVTGLDEIRTKCIMVAGGVAEGKRGRIGRYWGKYEGMWSEWVNSDDGYVEGEDNILHPRRDREDENGREDAWRRPVLVGAGPDLCWDGV